MIGLSIGYRGPTEALHPRLGPRSSCPSLDPAAPPSGLFLRSRYDSTFRTSSILPVSCCVALFLPPICSCHSLPHLFVGPRCLHSPRQLHPSDLQHDPPAWRRRLWSAVGQSREASHALVPLSHWDWNWIEIGSDSDWNRIKIGSELDRNWIGFGSELDRNWIGIGTESEGGGGPMFGGTRCALVPLPHRDRNSIGIGSELGRDCIGIRLESDQNRNRIEIGSESDWNRIESK